MATDDELPSSAGKFGLGGSETPNSFESLDSSEMCDDRVVDERKNGIIVHCQASDQATDATCCVDCVEERFRVDRRKLEQLIQVVDNGDEENAEQFFAKIMKQTNTVIAWPSKLKIGAKSKKDPHIKVSGTKQAVAEAKERILNTLNTKNSRVTLKMEVAYTEHSHVIGKGGYNIKRVMQETSCHIHFPDSNRNSQVEKSNQVSIAGPCSGVEDARQRIRELQPLVFMFDLPSYPGGRSLSEISQLAIVQQVQQTYGVSVTVRPHHRAVPTYAACTVIVRGSIYDSKSVKEATTMLFEHFTGRQGMPFVVSLALDIAPQHHQLITGQAGANIKQIMQRTGATIHFPNPNVSESQQRGTIYITGSMASVCLARQQLLGYVPLVLMFDIDEDVTVSQDQLSQLMNQLHIYISVKPKPKQPSKSVIVKSMERNVANMYEARKLIMAYENGSLASLPGESSAQQNYDVIGTYCPLPAASQFAGQNLVPVALYPPLLIRPVIPSPTSPCLTPAFTNAASLTRVTPTLQTLMHSPAPGAMWSSAPSSNMTNMSPLQMVQNVDRRNDAVDLSGIPQINVSSGISPPMISSSGISLHISAPSLLASPSQHSPSRQHDPSNNSSYSMEELASRLVASLPPDIIESLLNSDGGQQQIDMLVNTLNVISNGGASCVDMEAIRKLCHDPLIASAVERLLTQTTGSEACSSFGNLSRWLPQRASTMASSHHQQCDMSRAGATVFPYAPGFTVRQNCLPVDGDMRRDGMMALGQLGAASANHGGSAEMNSRRVSAGGSSSACMSDDVTANQSKAPGNNRPNPDIKYRAAPGSTFIDFDYEQMKLRANRAIHTKPGGESRVPTDLWAGCGFSKSTPEADLRLRLNHNMFRRPVVPTTFESREVEIDADVWKDVHGALGGSTCMQNAGEPDGSSHASLSDIVEQLSAVPADSPSALTKMRQYGKEVERRTLLESKHDECMGGSVGNGLNSGLGGAVGMATSTVMPDDAVGGSDSLWAMGHSTVIGRSEAWVDEAEDLAELFSRLGLGKYTDIFQQQEIDLVTFLTLTDLDLKELGISTFGARRKMLNAITDINKRQTLLQAVPRLPSSFTSIGHAARRHDLASQSGRW